MPPLIMYTLELNMVRRLSEPRKLGLQQLVLRGHRLRVLALEHLVHEAVQENEAHALEHQMLGIPHCFAEAVRAASGSHAA